MAGPQHALAPLQYGCEIGDRAPQIRLADSAGAMHSIMDDEWAGRPTAVLFCRGMEAGLLGEAAAALGAMQARLLGPDRNLFLVLSTPPDATAGEVAGLAVRMWMDTSGASFAAYGLDGEASGLWFILLDEALRVVEPTRAIAPEQVFGEVAAALDRLAAESPHDRLDRHPPVLVLPRFLDPALCRALVEAWHRPVKTWTSDGLSSAGYDQEAGDFKVRNEAYGRTTQLILRNAELVSRLDGALARRLLPEISFAFQTVPARREDYRIARYDAAERGGLPNHRDNPSPQTRHRRFTLSVELDADGYDDGTLCFPEFGAQGYRVATGTAIVWSCALLHAVQPVTRGQRFILGTHLFGTP